MALAREEVKSVNRTSESRSPKSKRLKRTKDDDDDDFVTSAELLRLKSRGYSLERKLSQGCSSKIYLTTYRRSNKPDITMACKVIDKRNGEPKFITKFLPREVSILAQLSHPHCVQIYSILEIKTKVFVFMRYAENGDLLDYLTKQGALEENHARMWMRQLLLALKYLHSKKIAHRDVKCENVLITENLNAKLADFGFARYWTDDRGKSTLSETYCGSLSYAAPEILKGQPYSPNKCDVWSLGVVFFVMLNLAKPFSKNKASHLLQQQMERNYRFRAKNISQGAMDLIRSMLDPDYTTRSTPDVLLNVPWMREDHLLLDLVPDPLATNVRNEIIKDQDMMYVNKMRQPSSSSNRSSLTHGQYSSAINETLWKTAVEEN